MKCATEFDWDAEDDYEYTPRLSRFAELVAVTVLAAFGAGSVGILLWLWSITG